ncbi:MAG TPA: hypothetical protein VN918_07370 [Myxococcaceae bacterium]|jgi:hypothetical protein|nr:hypothetical protein [Myxococcaceae bacterium]
MPNKPQAPVTVPVAPSSALLSPFCGELRSKKYFMLNKLPTEASEYLDDADHCWCYVTQQVVGPDGAKVHPQRCISGRGCYKSALADSE